MEPALAAIGAPEILIVAVVVVALVGFIWGLVDAIRRGQTGWWVGMLVAWIFSLGWLVAWIYLLAIRPGLKRDEEQSDPGPGPPPPPPAPGPTS